MNFNTPFIKPLLAAAIGALLVACASTTPVALNAAEIGQKLGFSKVVSVQDVQSPATFTLEDVNSRAAVMGQRFGRNILVIFGHNCPEAGFGGTLKTTASGERLSTNDSIIIGDKYCRISELYYLDE